MKVPHSFRLLLFISVLVFTFIIRAHYYERTPSPNHLDEMMFAWAGMHLIETGSPVSWSTLPYPDRAEVFSGKIDYEEGLPEAPEAYVTLYEPWLDHPPLFSLLVGYSAHLFGADRNEFIPSSYIRFPMVFIATATSIMVFLIARFVSGYWLGILSMLLYGTVPIIVFASRSALSENLIAFLFTLIVYLLLKFNQVPKFWYILPIPLLIGIAGLSKATGYFLLLFAIFYTFAIARRHNLMDKAIKYSIYLVLATLPFIGLFFVYGMYYDPEIFSIIASYQTHRPAGFGSLTWFFMSPSFATTMLKDGWYVFCLLAAAYFLFTSLPFTKEIIKMAFVFWVLVVMISSGEGDLLAWYRFAAFPFLAILGAWGLQLLVKNANFFTTFLTVGLLLSSRSLIANPFRPNFSPGDYRIILSGLLFPSIVNYIFEKDWIKSVNQFLIIGVIVVGVVLNSLYIYKEFEISCESIKCPLVPSTFLSTVRFPFIGNATR